MRAFTDFDLSVRTFCYTRVSRVEAVQMLTNLPSCRHQGWIAAHRCMDWLKTCRSSGLIFRIMSRAAVLVCTCAAPVPDCKIGSLQEKSIQTRFSIITVPSGQICCAGQGEWYGRDILASVLRFGCLWVFEWPSDPARFRVSLRSAFRTSFWQKATHFCSGGAVVASDGCCRSRGSAPCCTTHLSLLLCSRMCILFCSVPSPRPLDTVDVVTIFLQRDCQQGLSKEKTQTDCKGIL